MTRSPVTALAAAAAARPRRALAAVALLTLAAAPGLLRLELRTDGKALVPPSDPAVEVDAEIRERFGLRDVIVVLFEGAPPDGIYQPRLLDRVARASRELAALDGVGELQVTSLATERRDRVHPGTLTFRRFLEPPPETPEQLAELRSDVEAAGILVGTLVSADHTAASVLVGVPPGTTFDRTAFYRRVAEVVRPLAEPGIAVRIVGAPVAESQLGSHVLADLRLLLPLAIAVITAVVWAACRRIWVVALAFFEVAACLVFTFGLMGWTGAPVYLTTAVLPVVLVSLGLADEIHVLWHYRRELRATPADAPATTAVVRTFERLGRPLALTSLTTGTAFLSFLGSEIPAVSGFGLFAAAGIAYCFTYTVIAMPAALALVPRRWLERPARTSAVGGGAAAVALAPLVRRPRATLALLAVATAGLALGLPRLDVQDSWVDGFAAESPLRRDIEHVNAKLHGTHLLLAEVDFDPSAGASEAAGSRARGPLLVASNLEAIGDLERFIRDQPQVGGVLGPHDHLTTVAYLWLARREEDRRIPAAPARIETVLERFVQGRGEHRLREVIDPELRRGLVTIFLEDANYRDTAALTAAIRAYAAARLEPLGARLRFAGDVAVSQAMIPAIVRTQIGSLLFALAGAMVIVTLLYRSPVAGLLVLMPASTAVLWVLGAMGWSGIPLGVATSMFCAVTLGVGVDYAIHFFERYRFLAGTAGGGGAVLGALREAGPAILADTAAIAMGFGLLSLSQVPGNARLGLLVALALISSCLLTLVGLGSLLELRSRARGPVAATGLAKRAGEA